MDLFEAFDAGVPLLIEVAPDNHRALAAVVLHPDGGIVFADTGWPGATWHPFHWVEGQVRGEGPWFVGETRIRALTDDDPAVTNWLAWHAYRESPEGQWATPARARAFMVEDGLLPA